MKVIKSKRSVTLTVDFTDEPDRPALRTFSDQSLAVYDTLTVQFWNPDDTDEHPYVTHSTGWCLKEDGTPSGRRVNCTGVDLARIPEPFRVQIVAAAMRIGEQSW